MDVLIYLLPIALSLGVLSLAAFFWALKSGQFDDPEGAANRILRDDPNDSPTPQSRPGADRSDNRE